MKNGSKDWRNKSKTGGKPKNRKEEKNMRDYPVVTDAHAHVKTKAEALERIREGIPTMVCGSMEGGGYDAIPGKMPGDR